MSSNSSTLWKNNYGNITIMAAEQKSNCLESNEILDVKPEDTTIDTVDDVLRDTFYEEESRREVV